VWISTHKDITGNKQTPKRLQQHEDLFRLAFENANDGVCVVDTNGNLVSVNNRMCSIFGYRKSELESMTVNDIAVPEDKDISSRFIEKSISGEVESTVFRKRYFHKQGHIILGRVSSSIIKDKKGDPLCFISHVQDITQRNHAEIALLENEERLRGIVGGVIDWIWEVSADGRYTFCSGRVEKILGYSPDEMIGKTPFEFMPPDEAEKIGEGFKEIAAQKKSIKDLENWNVSKDGRRVCLLTNGVPVLDEAGQLLGFRGIDIDITERKMAELRMDGLNCLMEEMLKSGSPAEKTKRITDGVVDILGADFARIWLTKQGDMCDTGCLHAKAAEGPHICRDRSNCLHMAASSGRYTHINGAHGRVPFGCYKIGRVAAGLEPGFLTNDVTHDPRVHDHDWAKELGLISFAGYRLLSQEGRVLGVLALFSKQILSPGQETLLQTIAKAASKMIQASQSVKALRKSEEKNRILFQFASDAVFVIDTETLNILDANEAAIKLYGYGHPEFLQMKITDLSAEGDKTRKSIRQASDILIPVRYSKKKDGTVFPVEITASYITFNGRKINISAVRDISERIKFEKEKEKIKVQQSQAQKMESIGTLAGGIAHNFNNILNIIVGNADLALWDLPKWNPAYTYIEEIQSASFRAANIVKQLLHFSSDSDQEQKPTHAVSLIKNSLKFLRSTIPTTIEFRKHLPDAEITILADPIQINQVMINICTNASQAMEDTGGILEVTVENMFLEKEAADKSPDLSAGAYLKIMVSDTGPGIPVEIIDQIFDPYFTTKEMGQGSGMGLSMVHSIVKKHGGTISVDSRSGSGATFSILFPIIDEKPEGEFEMDDDFAPGTEAILFVDDEKAIADMAQKILQRIGYRVEARLNPKESLALFKEAPYMFDLIITDMTMPQMTGVTLFEKIKDIRPDIPIIICTGHSALMNEEKAKELGVAAYVMKPINMKALSATIRDVLDKY